MLNISPSASVSYPKDYTPEQIERSKRIMDRASKNEIAYGYALAEYLIGLEDKINELQERVKSLENQNRNA